jgi:5-(aminomethyl)-3-furanmethanol phosphate kinase
MTRPPLRVIKLGGSLLDWSELAPRFRVWLAAQTEAVNVVIVGGGAVVDAMRHFDRQHHLTAEAAHWLSIRAMSLTADLVSHLLPEARRVSRVDELRCEFSANLQIFEVEGFLREDAATDDALPCGWEVTSDSIAARVANVLGASELVLLKSTLPEPALDREGLAQDGLVDAHFARVSRRLAVRIVNLRDPTFSQLVLLVEQSVRA